MTSSGFSGTVANVMTSDGNGTSAWEKASAWAWMAHYFAMRLKFYTAIVISLASYIVLPTYLAMYNTALAEKQSLAMEMIHENMKDHWREVYINSALNAFMDLSNISSFRPQFPLLTLEDALNGIPDPIIVTITNYVLGNALQIAILIGVSSFVTEFLTDPWAVLEALFGNSSFSRFIKIFGEISRVILPTIWLSPVTAVFYILFLPFNRTQ